MAGEPTAAMHVHLDIGGTSLDLSLPVPGAPARLRELLPAVHALSNRFIAIGVEGMAAQGQQVSCRAGCGACCRQLVPIAAAEAHALRELVDTLPAERQARVRQRFDAALRRLGDAALFDRLDAAAAASTGEWRAAVEAYFSLGIACPFLEDESCSIHAARPVACREYLVTSPPERCASAGGAGVDNVTHVFKVKEALLALGAADQPAGPIGFVPMIRALEWSAAHPDATPERDAAQWLDALFRRLHDLL